MPPGAWKAVLQTRSSTLALRQLHLPALPAPIEAWSPPRRQQFAKLGRLPMVCRTAFRAFRRHAFPGGHTRLQETITSGWSYPASGDDHFRVVIPGFRRRSLPGGHTRPQETLRGMSEGRQGTPALNEHFVNCTQSGYFYASLVPLRSLRSANVPPMCP